MCAAGTYVNGTPALPYMLERRIAVLHQRLPELFHRVDALEAQIKAGACAAQAPRGRAARRQ